MLRSFGPIEPLTKTDSPPLSWSELVQCSRKRSLSLYAGSNGLMPVKIALSGKPAPISVCPSHLGTKSSCAIFVPPENVPFVPFWEADERSLAAGLLRASPTGVTEALSQMSKVLRLTSCGPPVSLMSTMTTSSLTVDPPLPSGKLRTKKSRSSPKEVMYDSLAVVMPLPVGMWVLALSPLNDPPVLGDPPADSVRKM